MIDKTIEIPEWLSRTEMLFEKNQLEILLTSNVLVVGLGGVGGICAEMLVRAGIGKMTIIDADVVEPSNKNRQLVALTSTNQLKKTTVLAARLLDINPLLDLTVIDEFIKDERTVEILRAQAYNYAVDCIDTLSPKVFFIHHCIEENVKVVSSLGAGGRVDPSQIKVDDISKTYNCNLAYYVRRRLKTLGVKDGVPVVFSTERIAKEKVILADSGPKKSLIGTVSYMPAIFGCTVASVVIRDLISN